MTMSFWSRVAPGTSKPVTFLIGTLVTILIVSGASYVARIMSNKTNEMSIYEVPPFNDCITDTIHLIHPDQINFDLYHNVWVLCTRMQVGRYALGDYLIRREKLIRQELDERVTLWMVVGITGSGVILAAIQLLMSYNLANAGIGEFAKDSEFVAERGRLSFKSSVTGLAILAISLIFFIVYVRWIYLEQDVTITPPEVPALTAVPGSAPPQQQLRPAETRKQPQVPASAPASTGVAGPGR